MKIVKGWPPLIEEIAAALPGAIGPGVLFSWGDTIFNPSGADIHPALIAHEEVHGARQLHTGVEAWWKLYNSTPGFRLEEEKLAHLAEYGWWRKRANRHQRRAALTLIAHRLSGPLYGRMIPLHKAETLLRKGTEAQ